jgi:hypothetical protein
MRTQLNATIKNASIVKVNSNNFLRLECLDEKNENIVILANEICRNAFAKVENSYRYTKIFAHHDIVISIDNFKKLDISMFKFKYNSLSALIDKIVTCEASEKVENSKLYYKVENLQLFDKKTKKTTKKTK